MCDFETNILRLLQEEKKRLTVVFVDKDASYMKSLDHGIKSAEKRLEECEYKQCVAALQRNYELVPSTNLSYWANFQMEKIRCRKD